jgi:hypothetical protein
MGQSLPAASSGTIREIDKYVQSTFQALRFLIEPYLRLKSERLMKGSAS